MLQNKRLAVVAALGILLTLLSAPGSQAYPCGRPSGCTGFELVSAGASYGWYPVKHRYEFIGGPVEPSVWKLGGRGKQVQRNGMLTLIARKGVQTKPVTSTWTGKRFYYDRGRWETRMRMAPESRSGRPYQVEVSLTPAKKKRHYCGAQDINVLHWSPNEPSTARFDVKALPNHRFTMDKRLSRSITNDQWHVFAVEVTPKRVLWFVDGRIAANEPRDEALSGEELKFQVRLIPTEPGKVHQKFRIQLDWARYWTLKKKNKKSVSAPRTTRVKNKAACGPVAPVPAA